ncbi:MAG: response regulator [Thermoplasmata archaeon]|nr:response regulator [Thermoplasmata archaeon]
MNKKILIVDDEPDMHDLLKTYLGKIEGVEIVSALSGEEGVEKYKELYEKGEEPALVVMDLNLSGRDEIDIIDLHKEGLDEKLDGVRATEQILKINPNANIWGYTAWFDTDWAEKLKNKGAKKIFGRTTPFKEFAKMVEKFLMEID